jgi:hypothetical protein
MNFQELQQTKTTTNCHKSRIKDKEGIQKWNQIEGESPIKPLLFFAEKTLE